MPKATVQHGQQAFVRLQWRSEDNPPDQSGRPRSMLEPRSDSPVVLDAETERALSTFLARLEGRYLIRESILFGSRARRTHRSDSDADLAVVLEGETGDRSAAVRDMAAIAFDVMLETGVLVSPLPLWAGEFDRPDSVDPALIRSIRHDGLRLR